MGRWGPVNTLFILNSNLYMIHLLRLHEQEASFCFYRICSLVAVSPVCIQRYLHPCISLDQCDVASPHCWHYWRFFLWTIITGFSCPFLWHPFITIWSKEIHRTVYAQWNWTSIHTLFQSPQIWSSRPFVVWLTVSPGHFHLFLTTLSWMFFFFFNIIVLVKVFHIYWEFCKVPPFAILFE